MIEYVTNFFHSASTLDSEKQTLPITTKSLIAQIEMLQVTIQKEIIANLQQTPFSHEVQFISSSPIEIGNNGTVKWATVKASFVAVKILHSVSENKAYQNSREFTEINQEINLSELKFASKNTIQCLIDCCHGDLSSITNSSPNELIDLYFLSDFMQYNKLSNLLLQAIRIRCQKEMPLYLEKLLLNPLSFELETTIKELLSTPELLEVACSEELAKKIIEKSSLADSPPTCPSSLFAIFVNPPPYNN